MDCEWVGRIRVPSRAVRPRKLSQRALWLIITPCGSPVDPLVKCRKVVSADPPLCHGPFGGPVREVNIVSVTTHFKPDGHVAKRLGEVHLLYCLFVNTILAFARLLIFVKAGMIALRA